VSLIIQLPTSDFRLDNETESILSSQTIEMGPLQRVHLWSCLQDIVNEAKQRQTPTTPPPIMVDFGPYNFFQNDKVPLTPSSNISLRDEKAIRLALGFSGETELWSKHHATNLVPHRHP
jgi:sterol 3beta-glucosyltransferase